MGRNFSQQRTLSALGLITLVSVVMVYNGMHGVNTVSSQEMEIRSLRVLLMKTMNRVHLLEKAMGEHLNQHPGRGKGGGVASGDDEVARDPPQAAATYKRLDTSGDQLMLLDDDTFDGSSKVVTLPIKPLPLHKDFTIGAWVKTSKQGTQSILVVSPGRWWMPGRAFGIKGGEIFFDIHNVATLTGTWPVAKGVWRHIAVTFSANDETFTFYVDGKEDESVQQKGARAISATGFDQQTVKVGEGYEKQNFFEGQIKSLFYVGFAGDMDLIKEYMGATQPPGYVATALPSKLTDSVVSSEFCSTAQETDEFWGYMKCSIGPQAIDTAVNERPSDQKLTKEASDLSVVAIGVPVTTNNVKNPSFDTLSLFTAMLPSFARHAEKGYRYWVYLAHDKGDAYYDNPTVLKQIHQWFHTHIQSHLSRRGVTAKLCVLSFNNPAKVPGPVFNFMMKSAYTDGADYLYRINDDTVFTSDFAGKFIAKLQSFSPPNVGAVGPFHKGGNTIIMTHDFVHRTHLDIFHLYYPTHFTTWYMDDWISYVYGAHNTEKVRAVTCDHISSHGTRYNAEMNLDQKAMKRELVGARLVIDRYCKENKLDCSSLLSAPVKFRNSEYRSPALKAVNRGL